MPEHTIEFFFSGSWNVNPEFDAVWYRSLIGRLASSYPLTAYDVKTEIADRSDDDGLRFFFTITAESREQAREIADEIFSCIMLPVLAAFLQVRTAAPPDPGISQCLSWA